MERNFSEPLHGGHISTADIHDNSESPDHFSIDLHTLQEAKNFSEKQKGFRDGLSYSIPQKVKKQGEMPLSSLGPIPLKNVEFKDGMSLYYCNLGNFVIN